MYKSEDDRGEVAEVRDKVMVMEALRLRLLWTIGNPGRASDFAHVLVLMTERRLWW